MPRTPGHVPEKNKNIEVVMRIDRTLTCLYALPMPTVAAINGHAIAAELRKIADEAVPQDEGLARYYSARDFERLGDRRIILYDISYR